MLRIDVPEELTIETVDSNQLSDNWRNETMASREIGDRWLERSTSALLQVPSAIAQGQNFLLNPAHPDAAKIVVAEIFRAPFDARLLG